MFKDTDWDLYAEYYDTLTALKTQQELLHCLQEFIPQNAHSLLDIGCGTGTLLALITHSHPHTRLFGIDPTPAMLDRAAKKLPNTTTLALGTLAEHYQAHTQAHDVVISCNVLYTAPNPATFLNQLSQCLTPGGTFIIATPKQGFENGLILKAHCADTRPDAFWHDIHRSESREHLLIKEAFGAGPLAIAMQHVAKHNRMIAATTTFHFLTEDELRALCQAAHLEIEHLLFQNAKQTIVISGRKTNS